MVFNDEGAKLISGKKVFVEIKGDLVPDIQKPAVALDGNFFASQLPSGESTGLPTGDGVPGGTFWSWFTFS